MTVTKYAGGALSAALFIAASLYTDVAFAAGDTTEKDAMETGFLKKTIRVNDTEARYVVYVPADYTPDKAWPLIVFLHGAGERGDDGEVHAKVGIGPAIEQHPERFPAIVLMPQCPDDTVWNTTHDVLDAQMGWARATYNIDAHRIYLTGLSMGGYGTWLWGAIKTDTIAALIPICGGGDPYDIQRLLKVGGGNPYGSMASRLRALATVPIWAFHGGADGVVPPERSRSMVEAIKARGGNIQYTEYEGVGHNSWDATYGNPEAIAWLFNQRKE